MHWPGTILLSSFSAIIEKVHVKYLSQRVDGFREKTNRINWNRIREILYRRYRYEDTTSFSKQLFLFWCRSMRISSNLIFTGAWKEPQLKKTHTNTKQHAKLQISFSTSVSCVSSQLKRRRSSAIFLLTSYLPWATRDATYPFLGHFGVTWSL